MPEIRCGRPYYRTLEDFINRPSKKPVQSKLESKTNPTSCRWRRPALLKQATWWDLLRGQSPERQAD
ncbi:hypothetical protein GN958_ATG04966 [Phytophthora infestans]|uniref:Uncharacterized protein n=1 Tax=Phytophthora infestans TaxID=4787 RepID=A0A8S9UXL4_PHYIN|nr:hypothetical protein GN958_ATG04966 [Phytophthora infestans]